MDVKKLMAEGSLDNLSEDLFKSVSSYSEEVKAFQRQKAAEYADQVVAALKKIEQDIKDRYDRVGLNLEKRVLNIKDGKDGINGRDGRDGKDGKPGAVGLPGRDGKDGKNGRDGVDGKDGVSVVNAFLDFDNSLVIELSNGKQVNAGAILGADFAEKVKIIANGGGTSQGVIDTLASLQAQISAISSLGAVSYQGTWNASTNTPTITASVGTKGYYYVVSVAGTTSINGESKWGVGDWIVFNGSTWQKVDGGSTGNLTTLDVSSSASIGGALTLSAYSGNTIPYLNGSSVINAGSALSFDGTNLGIGLASPSRQLTVYGSSPYIALQNSTTGATSGDGLQIQMAGGEAYIWNYENNFLSFGTNITERMRIAGNGDISLNGGTANGVAYLNGSKVVTTGSALTFDGSQLGVGTASGTSNGLKLNAGNAGANYVLYRDGTTGLLQVYGNQSGFNGLLISGVDGQQYLTDPAKHVWSVSNAEQMRLTSTGLGIGTSSPGAKLQVTGGGKGTIFGSSSTLNFYSAWQYNGTDVGYVGNGASIVGSAASTDFGLTAYTNGKLWLGSNNGASYAVLDSSGNLGIGTASPAYKLDVSGTAGISGNVTLSGGTANGVAYLNGSKVVTTGSALTFDGTNLGIGNISPSSYNGAADNLVIGSSGSNGMTIVSGTANAGYIMFADGTTGQQAYEGQITYDHSVNQMWFNVNAAEQMRLTSTGLGIGTSSPGVKLDVVGTGDTSLRARTTGTGNSASVLIYNGNGTTAAGYSYLRFVNEDTNTQDWRIGTYGNNNLSIVNAKAGTIPVVLDTSGNLGLGVTPSGWATLKAFDVGTYTGVAGGNGYTHISNNAYLSTYASTWTYKNTNNASLYSMDSGTHKWYTAPSGTAGNAISFTQAMTLDASGNLLVGASSGSGKLYVENSSGPILSVLRNTVASSYTSLRLYNDQNSSSRALEIDYMGSTYSGGEMAIIGTTGAYPLTFSTGNTERARITSGGYFKASNDGTYVGSTDTTHEFRQTDTNNTLVASATNASYSSTVFRGIVTRAASTAFDFEYYTANSVLQWQVRGDGNAYNVNGVYGTISDQKLKQDIVDAGSQWADIKAIRFRKYRMKSDVAANPDAPALLGVVAQELEQTSPGLVDESPDRDAEGNDLGTTTKSVKTSVLLMKAAVALQEAMTRIEALEAEVAALKSK